MTPKDRMIKNDPASQTAPNQKRHYIRWSLLALFLIAIAWAVISDNPFAEGLRALAGAKPDQPLLDNSFIIAAHSFRYYKSSLPSGSSKVEVIGQFSVASVDQSVDNANTSDASDPERNNIEVYVLGEEALSGWQSGSAPASVYASGKASHGTVRAQLPAGAGTYYLIFSNKFSPKAAKKVKASFRLRYKSWLPDWFRHLAE